jgi:uncharacterized protein YutE (UPF0331/DUF86 family)
MPVEINHLRQRIGEVLETIAELKRLTSKSYSAISLDEKFSLRYHVIVLAEALGSICVHLLMEDFGCEPRSYSECFKLLEERGVFSCAEDLIRITRLRNLLVHRYWIIKDAEVYEAVKKDFRCVDEFLRRIKERYGII